MSERIPLGSGANSNRVFIDLTDSDKEAQLSSADAFVTTLAHRSPEKPVLIVPSKRKSLDPSEESSDTSSDVPHRFGRQRRQRLSYVHPSTPSPPLPSLKGSQISVVIPSPPAHQRRQFAQAPFVGDSTDGMSHVRFPTNEEQERVSKASYPSARDRENINRQNVPLSFKSGFVLNPKSPSSGEHLTSLRQNLEAKLATIKGPAVTPVVASPGLLAKLADNFVFVNEYQYRAGVEHASDFYNCGCVCSDGCDPTQCDCLGLEEDVEEPTTIVPYKPCDGDKSFMVVTQEFLHRQAIILECTSRCKCKKDGCWNHVVQNGRKVRLEIFDTGPRGFGLRSPDFIRTGQFIDNYLGEVITKAEADAREALSEGRHTQSYLFSLDWYNVEGEDEEKMNVIDGRKFGSPTRFMNHSCNPNCKIMAVSTKNQSDHYLYNLAFFAYRDIPPGTELTFDYNSGTANTTPQKIDPDAVPCLCGEDNCRGQLWPNKRKSQGTRNN